MFSWPISICNLKKKNIIIKIHFFYYFFHFATFLQLCFFFLIYSYTNKFWIFICLYVFIYEYEYVCIDNYICIFMYITSFLFSLSILSTIWCINKCLNSMFVRMDFYIFLWQIIQIFNMTKRGRITMSQNKWLVYFTAASMKH